LTLWHIGNTTVRTPYRLKEALIALKNSEFHGDMLGPEREEGFARLLNEKSIVKADRIKNGKNSSDLGRKWRSALGQLGFVTIHLTHSHKKGPDPNLVRFSCGFPELSGTPYEITPNGKRLINAESVSELQECFLKALAAYRIPSIFEPRYIFPSFSPLRFVIEILLELEKKRKTPIINFEEMALIVQCRTTNDLINNVISEILQYREQRNLANNKKKFDNKMLLESGKKTQTKGRTLIDYSDLNFRYLKATGLFYSKGRSIAILPEKKMLAELLCSGRDESYDQEVYVKTLWNGAKLPTDDRDKALEIVNNLFFQLKENDKELEKIDTKNKSMDDLFKIRHYLENRLQHIKELEFADYQYSAWEEILQHMKVFISQRQKSVFYNDEKIIFPKGEMPAYFEWTIWRAFLAIDSLKNMPWESRRFKVDQDFFPLSHAPAGGPDMIFEFEEYVLVVEVTLSLSSRQEAVEGEPVRRHVAEIAEKFDIKYKRVYCLFIAREIDNNTAETFKIGIWYKRDDTKLPLQIVPITLDDFIDLYKTGLESRKLTPQKLEQILVSCRAQSNQDAPEWKKKIRDEIKRFIAKW
jgi:hypothetical protein